MGLTGSHYKDLQWGRWEAGIIKIRPGKKRQTYEPRQREPKRDVCNLKDKDRVSTGFPANNWEIY